MTDERVGDDELGLRLYDRSHVMDAMHARCTQFLTQRLPNDFNPTVLLRLCPIIYEVFKRLIEMRIIWPTTSLQPNSCNKIMPGLNGDFCHKLSMTTIDF